MTLNKEKYGNISTSLNFDGLIICCNSDKKKILFFIVIQITIYYKLIEIGERRFRTSSNISVHFYKIPLSYSCGHTFQYSKCILISNIFRILQNTVVSKEALSEYSLFSEFFPERSSHITT